MPEPKATSSPRVVHEDDSLLVIDKPAGMPSASLREDEQGTVSAWIRERSRDASEALPDPREAGLVNRLDNDTSGLLIAAKTPPAYEELRSQFASGSVRKRYLALVIGVPPERGIIDAPIAHHPRKRTRMVVCESEARSKELKARPAHTAFEALGRYRLGDCRYSLLSVTIKTGVRHQIRAHLAHAGHPISGDRLYRNARKRAADALDPPRHLLHAAKITLRRPGDGSTVTFESPLPDDFRRELSRLDEC